MANEPQAFVLYFDQKGIRIELIDGPQLAALIVERGLRAV